MENRMIYCARPALQPVHPCTPVLVITLHTTTTHQGTRAVYVCPRMCLHQTYTCMGAGCSDTARAWLPLRLQVPGRIAVQVLPAQHQPLLSSHAQSRRGDN